MVTIRSGIIMVTIGVACLMSPWVYASGQNNVKTAVNVVSELCLSGTEYGIDADLEGNITIKNFKPKGSGSVTLNVREAKGATAFQDDLRIIADDKVRECTQNHIGRILDAVLDTTEPQRVAAVSNKSLGKAKYLGYVPDEVSIQSSVEGEQYLFYRFSVKEPSNIKIKFTKNSQSVTMYLLTKTESSIASGHYSDGQATNRHFLMPGDYYVKVKARKRSGATAFKMSIEGLAEA